MILELLSKELRNLADRIDGGNTNINQEEGMEIIDFIKKFDKEKPLTKYEASKYLHVSRATFDNLVKEDKLPKGKKLYAGDSNIFWYQKDLNLYLKNK